MTGPPIGPQPVRGVDCPVCEASDSLTVERQFEAKPLGTWSLSGSQMKTTGRLRPRLRCGACGLDMLGHYDAGQAEFRQAGDDAEHRDDPLTSDDERNT